jgi:hypothetical protein
LGGIGILFVILGVLFKSFNMIFSGITFLGLAYMATTIPMWIIGAIAAGSILLMGVIQLITANKKKSAESDSKKKI